MVPTSIDFQSAESKEYIDLRTHLKDSSPLSQRELIVSLNPQNVDPVAIDVSEDKLSITIPQSQKSTQIVAQDSRIMTDSNAEVSYSDYVVDSTYINSL